MHRRNRENPASAFRSGTERPSDSCFIPAIRRFLSVFRRFGSCRENGRNPNSPPQIDRDDSADCGCGNFDGEIKKNSRRQYPEAKRRNGVQHRHSDSRAGADRDSAHAQFPRGTKPRAKRSEKHRNEREKRDHRVGYADGEQSREQCRKQCRDHSRNGKRKPARFCGTGGGKR